MMILLASATAAVPVLVNVNMVGLKVAVNPLWNSVFLEADSQNSTRAKIKEHRESRCSWRAVQGSNLRPVVLEGRFLSVVKTGKFGKVCAAHENRMGEIGQRCAFLAVFGQVRGPVVALLWRFFYQRSGGSR